MGKPKQEQKVTLVDKPKTINVEYQLLVAERDDLLAAEEGYRKRIREVEKEKVELLHSFDILYNENMLLRSKLDAPEGIGIDSLESYNAVYKDRDHMREANRAYKRRIKQLEDDANEAKKEYEGLNTKHQLLTQKAELEVEYATKNRDEKISGLEKEQNELAEKLSMFLKEREQYEYRIAEMDKERNELQNKYDFLLNDKHELQLRCDVLQADREKLKDKVLDLEASLPDPEQKAKEEQQFLTLQGQLAALQVANKDASIEIHKLKEELRELSKLKREKVEMVDRACSVIIDEEAEEQRKADESKQEEIIQELEQSKKRGMLLLKENDKMKTENAELESKLANYALENKKLLEEVETKKTELENLSVVVRGNESLNDDYNIVQEKLNDLAASKQVLEKELIQEKKNAKLKIAELNNEIEKSQQNMKDLQKQYNKSENDATKLQYEIDGLNKVTEAQALELRNMKSQLQQVQSMLEDRNLKYEQMKKTEKEAHEELHETKIQYHTIKREYENLQQEKAGNFGILKHEMETAKTERNEETDQLRQETLRLREEVKQLKNYEHKITTMDAEIRRLMNRIRMSDRYKKLPTAAPAKGSKKDEDPDRVEIRELKRKQREMEKEKLGFLQERKQWEILKEKYADLQLNNKRLVEENKRVRGDLDGTSYKIETLEKRFKTMNVKVADIKVPGKFQKAVYVEKAELPQDNLVAKYSHLLKGRDGATHATHLKATRPSFNVKDDNHESDREQAAVGKSEIGQIEPIQTRFKVKAKDDSDKERLVGKSETGHPDPTQTRFKVKVKDRKKSEAPVKPSDRKKSDRKSATVKPKTKRQALPKLSNPDTGLSFGKGYRELHKNRYQKPTNLALL